MGKMRAPPSPADDPNAEIRALVLKIEDAQRRSKELTGSELESVVGSGGHSFLLQGAQEQLRRSETVQRQLAISLKSILDALPAQIALLDSQGVIVSVNAAWQQFATANVLQGSAFGVGQSYLEICDGVRGDGAGDAHAAAEGIRQVLRGEAKVFALEYPCHSPAEKRWFRLEVNPVRESGLAGAVLMHIDITARKLTEASLRESEERFRGMFDSAATGIAISTPQGRYLQANEAYCRMLGYTLNELRELSFEQLTHPDDLTLNLKIRDELLAGQRQSLIMEKRYLKKNGEILWTRASVSATHSAAGEIETLVVVAEDITAGKLAEDAMRENEERFRSTFEQVAVGMAQAGTDGHFLRVNAKLCAITGYDEQELLHMGFADLTLPEELGECEQARLSMLTGEKSSFTTERRYRQKSGELIWVKLVTTLKHTAAGEPQYFITVFEDISIRKSMEEQILSKTALLEAELKATLDGVLIIDRDFKKILQNQQMTDMWGIPQDVADDPDDRKQFDWVLGQVKHPREFVERADYLYAHVNETGRDEIELLNGKIFDRYSAPVVGNDGAYYGRLWVFRDITERKVAEKALTEQVELMSMASSVGKLGVWSAEYPGPQLIWGQEVYRIFEVEANLKIEEEPAMKFFLPDSRAKMEEAIAKKQPFDLELEVITTKGNRRWVRAISAVEMKDGNLRRFYGILQDVTEQKRMENRFRRLVDSNVQGVIFWNKSGEILDANDGFLQLVGYTREDLTAGRINWRTLTPPEYNDLDLKALEEIAAKGVCTPFEKEYLRKDGSRVPVLIGSACFEDNPDEGVRFVLDLTERKKLEQQFLRAQRMESIGTLAGGIAHDLNNILAPIMMSIDILKMTVTDPQARGILQTIEVSSKRGADIVRQVLSFARGMEGERIEVQPKHLIKDIETIIRDTFPRNIQQQVLFPEDPWTIYGDPTLLHQILLNLCVNARDAMPNGGTLTIKVENCVLDQQYAAMNRQVKPGRYVLISVTDTGIGIPPAIIDKIFEPFFTTKEMGKGTGLGLSTVIGIVKSHEGVINVYSEPGRGTTFRVYLPAMNHASEGQERQTQLLSLPRGHGEMVLIVDDEASVLTITSQTLQAFGYRVLTATDGAEAVVIYAKHQNEIAVVLTDLMMPVMDGPSTIRALLRINPSVKIIAASGLNSSRGFTTFPDARIKHFLTKPYTARTLLKTLREILN